MKKILIIIMLLLLPNQLCFAENKNNETANVYIMRSSGLYTDTVGAFAPIYINGLLIDALKFRTYICYQAIAGKTKLSFYNGLDYKELFLDVQPGNDYYINIKLTPGWGGVSICTYEVLDQDNGKKMMSKCKLSDHSPNNQDSQTIPSKGK